MLHCAFAGCTWTADYGSAFLPDTLGNWAQEWCVFCHLVDAHADAFEETLSFVYKDRSRDAARLSQLPAQCARRSKQPNEMWQDDLFQQVWSDYRAAMCVKLRKGMPTLGVAVDRRAQRPLNRILRSVKARMCFGCAQIHCCASLWTHNYKPGKMGRHDDPTTSDQWSEHQYHGRSSNPIEMVEVRNSLQRFFKRDEANFRLHFDLRLFKERYCADDQEGGNPFRNSDVLSESNTEWVQHLAMEGVKHEVAVLCCPEDVERCKRCRGHSGRLCAACRIPLCTFLGPLQKYSRQIN